MVNKEYWDKFYSLDLAPIKESAFAEFILNYVIQHNLMHKKLLDVACGNGRDTFFFLKNGIDSVGVDLSVQPNLSDNFLQDDILQFDYKDFELIYLRFIVHALTEEELDQLINQIRLTSPNAYLFIETRSSKDVTNEDRSETYFKSSIGEEHFRMLYSKGYLSRKMSENFETLYFVEDTGLSIHKQEDPVCIRMILKSDKHA